MADFSSSNDDLYVDEIKVSAIDGGSKTIAEVVEVAAPAAPVMPEQFVLSVYPNPFNPSTNIQYSLPEAGHIELTIYDIHGRKVTELFNGYQEAGSYTLTWDAVSNDMGYNTSGIYLLYMRSSSFNKTVKMMLLK
jgi:hypothetical protein